MNGGLQTLKWSMEIRCRPVLLESGDEEIGTPGRLPQGEPQALWRVGGRLCEKIFRQVGQTAELCVTHGGGHALEGVPHTSQAGGHIRIHR